MGRSSKKLLIPFCFFCFSWTPGYLGALAQETVQPSGSEASIPGPPNFLSRASGNDSPAAAGPMLRIAVDGIGTIPVALDFANAPQTAKAIFSLAQQGSSGRVHRAEAVPSPASDGPPYALVQATVDDPTNVLKGLAHEGLKPIARGAVCLIGGTSDLFVSLAEHRGWEASMTVFGHVAESELKQGVEAILQQPIHQYTHPQYGTVMAMLNTPLGMRLEAEGEQPAQGEAQMGALELRTETGAGDGGGLSDGAEWQIYYSEGKPYYYNTKTKVTQWEKPKTFREVL